ncbi:MAG: glycoside hydrolase family 13 protein, partial [Lactobacillus sp.]|nr:glycoside hydrolase family 13 protein [Lactobacillus sp.]
MKIKYNAWDTEYKSPFGAIKARTTVTWRVKIDEPVDYINLWLTKAEETPVPYPMKKTDEQTYHVQVTIGTSGLYHYY